MKTTTQRAALRRLTRRRDVENFAVEQGDVVSLRQVYDLGVTRAEVRANLRADRWRRLNSQSICTHRGPLSTVGRFWAAVFEAGPRALLDGESSLIAAGLEHYESDRIRLSVPRGARVRRAKGLDIRQTRRWALADSAPGVLPRTRNDVAAIHSALWARTDRQAALLLMMAVQQGLCRPADLGREILRIRRDRRRRLIHAVLLDLLGGARSLSELDFARECRRRGLPEPTRQAIRKGRNGRYYLDVVWEAWGVVVEIDGIHHTWANQVISDALRHNDVTLDSETVLRLPLLGLRVAADEFFAQIETALAAAGCPYVAAKSA